MLLVAVLAMFTLTGCETFYGAREGFKKDMEDWKNKDTALHRADDWMKEHMW